MPEPRKLHSRLDGSSIFIFAPVSDPNPKIIDSDRCAVSAVDPLDPIVTPNEMASCFCWPHVFIEGAREARGFGKRRA